MKLLPAAKEVSNFLARFYNELQSLQLSSPRPFNWGYEEYDYLLVSLSLSSLQYHSSRPFSIWMVASHYIGNDEFFNRMFITVMFMNISWDKAMKHVLGLANSPYFGFLKHINNKTLKACVHTMVFSIDKHCIVYRNTMWVEECD